MTATVVVTGLVVLAVLDGAFSGFRSAQGRTGLIRHVRTDVVAQVRGAGLAVALLLPAAAAVLLDAGDGVRAGRAMLLVYAPYGAVVLLALLAYGTLGWRQRFLAMALVLGPLTLARPLVAVVGAGAGLLAAGSWSTRVAVLLAVTAVLLVEPVSDRLGHPPGGATAPGAA